MISPAKEKAIVVLLAEDDAAVRNLVAFMLLKEGYAVLAANDGQEALDICRQFKDPIHLLLTDVTMPRMTGVELAEQVLKKRSEIKILIMSGETVDKVLNQNTLDAFLRKPFMPPTLLKCVKRLLDSEFKGICDESDLLKDLAA
jgi:two-component system cell cycle sensor histidine kinase/response regulator CckA